MKMKKEDNDILLQPIGQVQLIDELPDKFEYGVIKNCKSKIMIHEKYLEGLTGLEKGDLIDVVYYMHMKHEKKLLFTPRINNPERKEKGIFATRSQYSINSLGITTVKIVEITRNNLVVLGLDAKDGSPIVDIKRHAPEYCPD